MSAVAERLNFSMVHGAAFPLRGVSAGGGTLAIAALGRTATVAGKAPAAALLTDGGELRRSKLGIETAQDCIALARFCSSGPVMMNLSSPSGFPLNNAACTFAVVVVPEAIAVVCG